MNMAGKSLRLTVNMILFQRIRDWAELDTDEVIEKCFDVIRESASYIESGSVVGLGISCQGEAFTLTDKEGRALCNALVSSDIRANDYIGPWTSEFGEEKLYNITGHTPHPMFSLFKLLWIKENSPEIWSQANKILCFEDLPAIPAGNNGYWHWLVSCRQDNAL